MIPYHSQVRHGSLSWSTQETLAVTLSRPSSCFSSQRAPTALRGVPSNAPSLETTASSLTTRGASSLSSAARVARGPRSPRWQDASSLSARLVNGRAACAWRVLVGEARGCTLGRCATSPCPLLRSSSSPPSPDAARARAAPRRGPGLGQGARPLPCAAEPSWMVELRRAPDRRPGSVALSPRGASFRDRNHRG